MNKPADVLTREQILIAAEAALRRYGVAKTSVTDVAKALQVSHGTLYRHFKSKSELLEGVTAKWLEEKIIGPLTEIYLEASSGGVRQLKVYIQKLISLKQHYAREDGELFRMYAKVTEEAGELISAHVGHMISHLSEIISRSSITAADPERLARSILHATARFHHPSHAYEWANPGIADEFAAVWELLEKGLE